MGIKDDITAIKGIGPKKAGILRNLKINTIEDLLHYYPRDYEDRRELKTISSLSEGETALIQGKIMLIVKSRYGYSKKRTIKLLVADNSGSIEVIFFNAAYIEKSLKKDVEYRFYGKITEHAGRLYMAHPEFSLADKDVTKGIFPIYPLTYGITQGEMRKWQMQALEFADGLTDYIPEAIIINNRLCSLEYAIKNIHFPKDILRFKEAKYRLVFDELFLLQIGLLAIKKRNQKSGGIRFNKEICMKAFTDKLPFEMTDAQKRVISEIENDMESEKVMNRLIQGDVGSGKTAVAAACIYKAVKSGYQAALMAPTELLARQHYSSLKASFEPFNIKVDLLTGSMNKNDQDRVKTDLINGKTDLLIGTHAVIQPDVNFNRLGLVITDEQHRFGVNQRGSLCKKGDNPDILVMTATPIPRTLAAILYGDMDISVIDELPPGRKPVMTITVTENKRDFAYEFVRKEVRAGRQAYIVAPLIEESMVLNAVSATGLFEELKEKFNGQKVRLIHGDMKQSEKDKIMEEFYSSEIDILVSTVVIEVGINVPNATVMLIENAERFGLATLHQLRGRVGRGEHQSYCILVTDTEKTGLAKERAEIMKKTNDGFIIAEKDLELRGPGEFFGTRQHGLPELRLANLSKHLRILETVRNEADMLLEEDPDLSASEHKNLKTKMQKIFENIENLSI